MLSEVRPSFLVIVNLRIYVTLANEHSREVSFAPWEKQVEDIVPGGESWTNVEDEIPVNFLRILHIVGVCLLVG
jgi:hypothetical protein